MDLLLKMIREALSNQITISTNKSENSTHYKLTPYQYVDVRATKVTLNDYVDLREGLIEMIEYIKNEG